MQSFNTITYRGHEYDLKPLWAALWRVLKTELAFIQDDTFPNRVWKAMFIGGAIALQSLIWLMSIDQRNVIEGLSGLVTLAFGFTVWIMLQSIYPGKDDFPAGGAIVVFAALVVGWSVNISAMPTQMVIDYVLPQVLLQILPFGLALILAMRVATWIASAISRYFSAESTETKTPKLSVLIQQYELTPEEKRKYKILKVWATTVVSFTIFGIPVVMVWGLFYNTGMFLPTMIFVVAAFSLGVALSSLIVSESLELKKAIIARGKKIN